MHEQSHRIVDAYIFRLMDAGPTASLDLIEVSGAQLRMLAELTRIWGVDFAESRAKVLIASLLGYIVPGTLSFGSAGSLLNAIPAEEEAPAALFSAASTRALGDVFVGHFESGGTLMSFDPARVREYFQQEYEAARKTTA